MTCFAFLFFKVNVLSDQQNLYAITYNARARFGLTKEAFTSSWEPQVLPHFTCYSYSISKIIHFT